MSSSSFINALRRFVALRGEVRLIRSDCGTNFIGAAKCMDAKVINVESSDMKNFPPEDHPSLDSVDFL
jgi:hypothetical protein